MESESPESRARYYLEKAIFTLKQMITDEPHHKTDIVTGVHKLKDLLSENYEKLGDDFCIEKGLELESMLEDYLKYDDPSLEREN